MRILLIGGNGFIGSPLASELRDSGHSVAIFHRSADKSPDKNVVRIEGDRNRLSDHLEQIQRFSPEVIVDLILSSGEQARQLISTSRHSQKSGACRLGRKTARRNRSRARRKRSPRIPSNLPTSWAAEAGRR